MIQKAAQSALREIPSVETAIQMLKPFMEETAIPRGVVLQCARHVIEETRQAFLQGKPSPADVSTHVLETIKTASKKNWKSSSAPAINATGILLHTGLGRAPLSPCTEGPVLDVLRGYSILAFDTATGKRKERHFHLDQLLAQITGAETGIIVNNNAAATLLVLSTLSKGKEAIISRGELVEIGGSFRLPDVMAQSGAIMREVGTTNKTHLRDYESAINENTGLIVKVHKSNYKVIGFSSEPPLAEMVQLGKRHGIPVYHDLGSGALIDFSKYGLAHEPMVQESIADGANIVTFSGDKLIGGPQSGIVIGEKKYVDLVKKNPLMRAIRCGKLTYAAIEATLKLFYDEQTAVSRNTTVRMLTTPVNILKQSAAQFLQQLGNKLPETITLKLEECETFVGGGSMPGEAIPSVVVKYQDSRLAAEDVAYQLRQGDPAIFTRVQDGEVIFDFRTISTHEIPVLAQSLMRIWKEKE